MSSPGCWRDFDPSLQPAIARAGAEKLQQQQQRRAVLRRRALSAERRRARERSNRERVADSQRRLAVLDRPAALAGSGCRIRSRTNPSWTNWRARVKADPVEFRLRHLSDPRLIDVVKAAAKAGELGRAAFAESRRSAKPASPRAAASPAWPTKATTDIPPWSPKWKSIRTPERSP